MAADVYPAVNIQLLTFYHSGAGCQAPASPKNLIAPFPAGGKLRKRISGSFPRKVFRPCGDPNQEDVHPPHASAAVVSGAPLTMKPNSAAAPAATVLL